MQHQPWNYCGTCTGYSYGGGGEPNLSGQANFASLPSMQMPPAPDAQNQQGVVYSPEAPVVYVDQPEGFKYQQTMMPCSNGMTGIKICPPLVFPPPANECDALEAAQHGGPAGLHELLGWPMFAGSHQAKRAAAAQAAQAPHAKQAAAASEAAAAEAAAPAAEAAPAEAPAEAAAVESPRKPPSVIGSQRQHPAPANNIHTVGGNGCPKVSIVTANRQPNVNNGLAEALQQQQTHRASLGALSGLPGMTGAEAGVGGGGLPATLSDLNNLNQENLCHIIYVFRQ